MLSIKALLTQLANPLRLKTLTSRKAKNEVAFAEVGSIFNSSCVLNMHKRYSANDFGCKMISVVDKRSPNSQNLCSGFRLEKHQTGYIIN